MAIGQARCALALMNTHGLQAVRSTAGPGPDTCLRALGR